MTRRQFLLASAAFGAVALVPILTEPCYRVFAWRLREMHGTISFPPSRFPEPLTLAEARRRCTLLVHGVEPHIEPA